MRGRKQYSLLVVRGDGVRVLRFNFPRPAVVGVFVVVAVAVSVLGALVGDWVQLRQLTREAKTFSRQIAEQRTTIDGFNRRVAELRQEMTGWGALHARIWEPFGPELTPGGRGRGIGGGSIPPDRLPARLSTKDELARLADAVMEQGENLRALDRLMSRAGKALAALPSRWPVRGAVNSEFGTRLSPWTKETEFHGGLDIRAEKGTPVRAPAAGTVTFAGTQPDYGITVIVDHGQDIRSVYGHLSRLAVKQGDRVERGGTLGMTGSTGRSSGPHLHYEVLVKGQPVNPRAYLWD
ncbi:MAG: M23 family metallopeptidase [Candidatus Rokubacteria bacterium]|nr:M23 family metallopeptidase [Candidatus Rokubacteria bacterium]